MAAACCFAREGGSVVAGLAGETYSGWLFIRYLWVSDALRGRGIGRKLMSDAEGRALERGCHSAWVDTFSFQAPGFYPKLGYQVFGELDYPPGTSAFFSRSGSGAERERRRIAVLRATVNDVGAVELSSATVRTNGFRRRVPDRPRPFDKRWVIGSGAARQA